MHSRTFNPVMALITTMLMLFGLASGCMNPVSSKPTTNPNSTEEVDTAVSDTSPDVATQSVTISGHTLTVDGTSLVGAWVAVADNSTQELISETSSDASGAFSMTLDGAVGDYTLVASHGDGEIMLAAWQGFSVYDDQVEDLTFNLNLAELPIFEESDDGAAPPPSGGCYRVYFGSSWCSNHILYRYYELSGAWYCSLVGAQVGAVGCC